MGAKARLSDLDYDSDEETKPSTPYPAGLWPACMLERVRAFAEGARQAIKLTSSKRMIALWLRIRGENMGR